MKSAVWVKSSILTYKGKPLGKRVKVLGVDGVLRVYDAELKSLPDSRNATVINRYLEKQELRLQGGLLVTNEEVERDYHPVDVSGSPQDARYVDSLRLFSGAFQGAEGTTWGLSYPHEQVLPTVNGVGIVLESLVIGKDMKQSKETREEYLAQTEVRVSLLFEDRESLNRFMNDVAELGSVPRGLSMMEDDLRMGVRTGQGVSVRVSDAWLWKVAASSGYVVTLPAHAFGFDFEQVAEGKGRSIGVHSISMTGNRMYWSPEHEGIYTIERVKAIEQRLKHLALRREQGHLTVSGLRGTHQGVPYSRDEVVSVPIPRGL